MHSFILPQVSRGNRQEGIILQIKPVLMSQAFVKESEGEWLHDVPPTISALILYLTRENNGVRVYEKSNQYSEKHKREVHLMSNGFSYAKDDNGKWYITE